MITWDLRENWKVIRSVIFTSVLDFLTLPRKCASAINAGYFKIIVKPMIKIKNLCEVVFGDQEHVTFIRDAVKETLIAWKQCEPNLKIAMCK